MKIHLLALSLFATSSIGIHAQIEWNKEIRVDQPPPGTSLTTIENLSGIGAVINKKDGKCVIYEVIKGSGAAAAGLLESDIITHIDSNDISSLDLLEIAFRLRGDPETKVLLTIQRVGEAKPRNYTVVRRPVTLQ